MAHPGINGNAQYKCLFDGFKPNNWGIQCWRFGESSMNYSNNLVPANAANPQRRLEEVGRSLHSEGIFTGGPPQYFEIAGRLQLAALLREGVYPWSKVLDIGCGCLRGGYWLIHFLDTNRYFGIEPNTVMLQKGIERVLEHEVFEQKQPHFDTNDKFDFSVFGEKFDVVIARSIWSHASKAQVQIMLDGFLENSSPQAFFMTSYYPARFWAWRKRDYTGKEWKGRSHQSRSPDQICHSFHWITEQVRARGMFVKQLADLVLNGQYWIKVARTEEALGEGLYGFQ
jgi:SAM-dependent methyltransferase